MQSQEIVTKRANELKLESSFFAADCLFWQAFTGSQAQKIQKQNLLQALPSSTSNIVETESLQKLEKIKSGKMHLYCKGTQTLTNEVHAVVYALANGLRPKISKSPNTDTAHLYTRIGLFTKVTLKVDSEEKVVKGNWLSNGRLKTCCPI